VGRASTIYQNYYWGAELTRQSAMFLVVVSLALDVIPDNRRRRMILNLVMAGAGLFWLGSLLLTYQSELNPWMTQVVRNLSFGSAVLDLGLWFALISSRSRDTTRLMIVGGLGLQMTGEAIGTSIRQLLPGWNTALAGSLFVVFAHFLCLVIWLYAFSRLSSRTAIEP
jgi:xanthosine utilization system XapX-like protein